MDFKKLALATAIAAVPVAGFSLEAIEDEALSEVSGQDGVSLELSIPNGLRTDIWIHDKDGLNSAAVTMFTSYSYDGAIVIQGLAIGVGNANPITINVDAGDRAVAATQPVLNVQIVLPAALTISTGSLHVANSGRDLAPASWGITGTTATILNNMTIILGNTSLNIQLGNEVQLGSVGGSDMMVLSAAISGGIAISGFRLSDSTASGDGGIGASSIFIVDAASGATNLTLAIDINATDAGLVVGLGQVGTAGTGANTGFNVNIVDLYLGSTSVGLVGDVSLVGLNVNGGTLTISGK